MSKIVSDEAIVYQMEKVDQGGAISDLFEDFTIDLVRSWNLVGIDCQFNSGDIQFPDGRIASLQFQAVVQHPVTKE